MDGEMNNSLNVSTEGEVLKCAKGADVSACGFTPGAKVCGKCGAMPIQMKMVPVDEEDSESVDNEEEDMQEDDERAMPAPRPSAKPAPVAMEDAGMEPEQLAADDDEEEDLTDEEKALLWEVNKKRKARGLQATTNGFKAMDAPEVDEEDDLMEEEGDSDEDDLTDEEKALLWKINEKRKARGLAATTNGFKGMDAPVVDEEDDMEEEDGVANQEMLEKMRKKRIRAMGLNTDELGAKGYVCAIERKAYPGGASVCDDCPGGCVAEKGLPGLLHVEGIAQEMFGAKVLDSGYSAAADMFVVDVQLKSGAVNEVFIDGTTAEVMGFHRLDNSVFEQKSLDTNIGIIKFHEAADIAVKAFDGHVLAVEPDSFEGIEAYAVEIEAFDGKSYDVFVSLDGEVLGYDKYEMDEAEEIEAEAAEIALKRAFTEEQRTSMAEAGQAMPDGSFPIKSESDLRNAISAYGRAKDKEAAKRHIMKRAKQMGKENLIPSNWVMGGSSEKKSDSIDAELMASLIEFELLQAETENN